MILIIPTRWKAALFVILTVISVVFQTFIRLDLSNLLPSFITVFAIFFGFYITGFGVFTTSGFVKSLHHDQDPNDSRKTLLDNLVSIFKNSLYTLLISIVYLLVANTITQNTLYKETSILLWFSYPVFGVVAYNFVSLFSDVGVFVRVVRQTAAQDE